MELSEVLQNPVFVSDKTIHGKIEDGKYSVYLITAPMAVDVSNIPNKDNYVGYLDGSEFIVGTKSALVPDVSIFSLVGIDRLLFYPVHDDSDYAQTDRIEKEISNGLRGSMYSIKNGKQIFYETAQNNDYIAIVPLISSADQNNP